MTNPLMEYLPPISGGPKSQPSAAPVPVDPSGLPPLNLAAADNYYGRKAYDYDLNRDDCEKWAAEHEAIQNALKGFSGTLLDIPCGTGRFFQIYREYGIEFIGMDKSPDMYMQIIPKFPWVKKEQIRRCDIGSGIPIENKTVDVTVCAQFLKFLPEHEFAPVFREVARVTRHNILCSLFTSDAPTFRDAKRNWKHQLAFFNAEAEASGFRIAASAPIEPAKGHHIWMLEAA